MQRKHQSVIEICIWIFLALTTARIAYNKFYLSRHGLIGTYYTDINLRNFSAQRRDNNIDFHVGFKPSFKNFPRENYSIRWTGYLYANRSGKFRFFTMSDDGVRLWIDNILIIDNWTRHWSTLDEKTFQLAEGYHNIKVEYFQGVQSSEIRLFWQRPGDNQKAVIPSKCFYPGDELFVN